ncbi:unnamed protein product [Trichobilharzia szidati]|nr:unnamed protein product [Trichobilharzia szidati]
MSSVQSLVGFLEDNLLYPKGPGLGAAQLFNNTKSAFHVGTLSAIDSWEINAYSQFIPLVSDSRSTVRDDILRECMLHLPIPLKMSPTQTRNTEGVECQRSIDLVTKVQEDEISGYFPIKRRFKPLFYTDSSLYCTSMPLTADNKEYNSPGDGLIIRPSELGLFILHVSGNYPPTHSLNSLERCLQTFDL